MNAAKEQNAGYIETIELIDFMCHRHLKINLSPRINFINGQNGSGKSAILTALTVCLGGRASATQRGTSTDSLIREGASTAKARIILSNKGANAYQYSTYGDHIIIERVLRRGNGSAYTVQNSSGSTVISKKDEINSICDHFCIQVDNPLAVLTQETAKRFLANSKPKDLYEFFMKATQLEQLSIDYSFALDRMSESRQRLDLSRSELSTLSQSVVHLENQLARLEKLKQAHQILHALRSELTWAIVADKELNLNNVLNNVKENESKLADMGNRLNTLKSAHSDLVNYIAEMEALISKEQFEINPLNQAKISTEHEIQKFERKVTSLSQDLRVLNEEYKEVISEIERLDLIIKSEQDPDQTRSNDLKRKLEELNLQQTTLIEQIGHLRERTETVSNNLDSSVEEQRKCDIECKSHVSTLENLKEQLQRLERGRENELKIYGDRIPELLAELRQSKGQFSRLPVGPLGLHVKLKDQKWALPVEVIIKPTFNSFIVQNHQDRITLQRLLKKYDLDNSVMILDYDQDFEPQSGLPSNLLTVYDVLEISNKVVEKALIIMHQIESIVLIEDRKEAMNLLQAKMKNITAIYTPQHRLLNGSFSNSVTYLHSGGRVQGLFSDVSARVNALRDRIKTLQRKDQQNKETLRIITNLINEKNKEMTTLRRELQSLDLNLSQLKGEIRQTEDEMSEKQNTSSSILEKERLECEARLKAIERQVADCRGHQQSSREKITDLKTELSKIIDNIEDLKRAAKTNIENISSSMNSRKNLENELKSLESEINITSIVIESKRRDLIKLEGEVEEMKEAALKICPRVSVTKSINQLDNELAAQEECIRISRDSNIDPIEIRNELVRKKGQYKEAENNIKVNERLLQSLSSSLELRQRAWEDFRQSVSMQSTTDFIFLLTARGYKGTLEYKHHDGELLLKVIPQNQSANEVMDDSKRRRIDDNLIKRDVRQLSGGEKSYSTSCFLISLWQAMGSPLRCLDEFDVFMDPINRVFILDMLVTYARNSRVQFILISPNQIPYSITSAYSILIFRDKFATEQDVRIHRLRDPERNQGVLRPIPQ